MCLQGSTVPALTKRGGKCVPCLLCKAKALTAHKSIKHNLVHSVYLFSTLKDTCKTTFNEMNNGIGICQAFYEVFHFQQIVSATRFYPNLSSILFCLPVLNLNIRKGFSVEISQKQGKSSESSVMLPASRVRRCDVAMLLKCNRVIFERERPRP